MMNAIQVFVPEDAIENKKVWVMVGVGLKHSRSGRKYSTKIPGNLNPSLFAAGWQHGWQGRQLTRREHLKNSFREGYRASKFAISKMRGEFNILEFPTRYRFRTRAVM